MMTLPLSSPTLVRTSWLMLWCTAPSVASVQVAMKRASETYLKGILSYTSDEVVSSDFIHDKSSSIFDAGSGVELNSKFFKLVSWYDNEWGYSNRVVDLTRKIAAKL